MAIVLATAARNAGIAAIGTLVNGGSLVFHNASHSIVATLPLAATAFGAPATGTITAGTITPDTNAAGGVIAHAHLRTSDTVPAETIQLSCTVTGGGGDITLTSLTIGAGDTVSMTSLTLTQPA